MKTYSIFFYAVLCFALYHQADAKGPKKCYQCLGTCNDPLDEVECTPDTLDWLCLSSEATAGDKTVITKSCMPNVAATTTACKAINDTDGGYCYTCDEDLCNAKTEKSTSKCYSCNGTCSERLEQEDCPDDGQSYLCRTSRVKINDVSLETRGCAPDNGNVNQLCKNIEKSDVGSCYTCHDDLCNSNIIDTVSYCYSCKGECNDPLIIEECPGTYDASYMCMAIKSTTDALNQTSTMEIRGCYPNADEIIETCKESNEPTNGSCYTCHSDLCNRN